MQIDHLYRRVKKKKYTLKSDKQNLSVFLFTVLVIWNIESHHYDSFCKEVFMNMQTSVCSYQQFPSQEKSVWEWELCGNSPDL